MKRIIVYPGSIPQDTDLLSTNQNTMTALGLLAQAILGTGTLVDGLACIPTTPPSLAVKVGPGSIYSQVNLEATSYGSLPADTTDQIVKQGIILGNTTFNCPAPVTSGQSVVYLVQAEYQDADGGPTVLPYYNASNPAVPYSGPANSGTPQNTTRDGVCFLSLKAGVAATTGTQVTPTPDAGFVGLWAITVVNGATTITSGNIAQLATAPFFTKLPNIKTGSIMSFSSGSSTVAGTTTTFLGTNHVASAAENNVNFIMPFNYKITNLYGYPGSTPTMGSRAYTVRINGADTTIAGSTSGTVAVASDTTHSFSGAAGDQVSVKLVTVGSDVDTHKITLMVQQV